MSPFDPALPIAELQACFETKLQILQPLRPGGQGELFVAQYNGEAVALKIYRDAHAVRAVRECEALQTLDCPNIVKIIEWGPIQIRGEECIYTITSLIEGETLRERISRGPMTIAEVKRLATDIANAINEMWSVDKIVHRDINPNNVMIAADGHAVVIDLGIAKHRNRATITEAGVSWGTNGYKSPEQARARKGLTYKSDYFALGIVLFEALTQRHPYNDRQELIGRENPIDITLFGTFPLDVREMLLGLLEIDPLNRPKDFAEIKTWAERN